jgi:TRAP-type C4-dicarboxylate transport system permease large subunit
MIGELWPFMWAQVGVLVLLTLFPWISTVLPGLFGYR